MPATKSKYSLPFTSSYSLQPSPLLIVTGYRPYVTCTFELKSLMLMPWDTGVGGTSEFNDVERGEAVGMLLLSTNELTRGSSIIACSAVRDLDIICGGRVRMMNIAMRLQARKSMIIASLLR